MTVTPETSTDRPEVAAAIASALSQVPAADAAPGTIHAASGNSAASATADAASARTPRDSQSGPYASRAVRSRSSTNAAAPGGRSAGSFAMPRATRSRSGSGTVSTGTGPVRCARISSARPPPNGRRPLTHSTNTQVAEYTSDAGVAVCRSHCSGAM
ncbi:hypothetical protein amrb99_45860 [Actinomadura sp. RB99]|nr:hypothetical protein [Actinomadura sp. RB99]